VALDCVAADNCKIVYLDTFNESTYYFVDCDSADCSSNSILPLTMTAGVGGGQVAMDCGSDAADCKIVYADSDSNEIIFVDCLDEICVYDTLTAPWTGQTNVLGVSLTYDSTNNRLYGHIIKDATEQAYFEDTDADTISWGTEFDYGFTTGDLNNISAPMSGAGSTEIAVVLRQNSNFEFSAVPEPWWIIAISGFAVIGWMKKRKRNGIRDP